MANLIPSPRRPKQLRAEGRAIFLTPHNLAEADELCDLIGIFRTRLLRLDTSANLRAGLSGRGTLVRQAGDAAAAVARALPFVRDVGVRDSALSIALDEGYAQNSAPVRALVAGGAQSGASSLRRE